DTTWSVRVEQVSFDGKNHLWLALEGDTRETVPALSGSTVTIRRPAGGPVRLTVRITTDAPALTPLGRAEIFNDEFHRFSAQVRQAIRENRAGYNRLVSAGQLARARALLAHLAATRENYIMVDDDFQLPVVAARYLADPRVPADRKRDFLRTGQHLERLLSNLAFVVRKAAPYARDPVAPNLV